MGYGTACTFSEYALDFIVSGMAYMVSATDRTAGLNFQWAYTTEFGILPCGLEASEISGGYYCRDCVEHAYAGDGDKQIVVLLYPRVGSDE